VKRCNGTDGQFAIRRTELPDSPAYRSFSRSSQKISRIEIDLSHHGGNDSGRPPATTEGFVQYGMCRTSVLPAIREAEALGFIRVTEPGRRSPNLFCLIFADHRDGRKYPPTDDWRRIQTLQETNPNACATRANKQVASV
jgi:hypothetical protein